MRKVICALAWLIACRAPTTSHFGVRLGDSMETVRRAFSPGEDGVFTIEGGRVPSLRWQPRQPGGRVHEAILEFHEGMLVAARFVVDKSMPEASGPSIEVTAASVVEREEQAGLVRIVVLSRSCPEHAEEVARVLSKRRASP